MGAWGYHPTDGDGAFEFFFEIERAIDRVLSEEFAKPPRNSMYSWDRIGAVQLLLEKEIRVPKAIVKKCLAELKAIRKDEQFADEWRNPENFRQILGLFINGYTWLLEKGENYKKYIYPPENFLVLKRPHRAHDKGPVKASEYVDEKLARQFLQPAP